MRGALEGIRVADFANHAVGPAAGAMLGALGAEVIKIEPPKGDPIRKILPVKSGLPTTSTVINLNKRSIVLDLKDDDDRALGLEIASRADVLIENFRAGVMDRLGLGYGVVSARNPGIVYCSSGSFGARGPMAAIGSTDPQGQAFGGYASINGAPDTAGEISRNMGYIDVVGSHFLVQGALTGLFARYRTGRGQHVQGSQMHWVIASQTSRLGHVFATGDSPHPMGTAVPHIVPSQAFRARDDRWIFVSAVTPRQWRGLSEALGHPEWADDQRFASNAARVEHRDEVVAMLDTAIAACEGSWWLQQLTQQGVPCTTELDYEDYLTGEHFLANRALIDVALTGQTTLRVPAPPWEFSGSATRMEQAPLPDQHGDEIRAAARSGDPWAVPGRVPVSEAGDPAAAPALTDRPALRPFDGVVVVDMTQGVSGPFATLCLGDYGATVWKVEPPDGDYSRRLGPPFVGDDSALFKMLNRNKQSIVLDSDLPGDVNLLKSLIRCADVLIEDLPESQRDQWALDADQLREINPRLVHCSISHLGRHGPWAEKIVSELELQAMTGATHYLGRSCDPPVRVGADICTTGAGQVAFEGVLAALFARQQTGEGQHVSVSELQSTLFTESIMLASYDHPDAWVGHHCSARGNRIDRGYETADEPIYFGSAYQSDQPWIDLCRELGMEELIDDPHFATLQQRTANAAAGKPLLEKHFRNFTRDQLLRVINETGNIAVPVNNHRSLVEHEQVLANDRIASLALQTGELLRTTNVPWEMSQTPGSVTLPPPYLDEHGDAIRAKAGSELEVGHG